IASFLDGLSHDARLESLRALDRREQRALYAKAAGGPPIGLDHFVPKSRGPRAPVRHFGRNTLPLPPKHKLFEKRFCRPEDGSPRLFGYNESPSRGLIGPGFFVAVPTSGHRDWEEKGGVVV